jgi:HAD superfamily hydrolase (TIGR01509 family)
MFDLVIFDCDGVLIDSEIISARMLIEELAGLGVHIDLAYVSRHFLGRSYPTVMAQIRREFGLDLPPAFEEQYRNRLLAAFETGLRIMPHVRDVLEGLRLPFCVATSSSPRRAQRSLEIVGLAELIGAGLFTSTMVAHGKPAPDLFLFAARTMGAAPARCLVIEDSLNGIRAGLAAGMTVWRFVGGSHMAEDLPEEPEDARPHLRFSSFADFYRIDPALKVSP